MGGVRMSYSYDRRMAAKAIRFPEGTMSEEEWVQTYAESVEEYQENWLNLFDRTKFNRMDGNEQKKYEEDLKRRAQKPHFRAWRKGGETFFDISKATFEAAKKQGIKVTPGS